MTDFRIPPKTIKALTLFTDPKGFPRLRNIHFFCKEGKVYAEAMNGHIFLRVELTYTDSQPVTDGDYGQYLPSSLTCEFVTLKDGRLFIGEQSVPQCIHGDKYPNTLKVMSIFEDSGMRDVTERYRLSLAYQVIIDKAITLLEGIKNPYGKPTQFKTSEGSNSYEYRRGNVSIIAMLLKD